MAGICACGGDGGRCGITSVKLGSNGALSVALAPNAGATPAGVYYTVVYQLGPGQVKTEYWAVPTTSPANLAAVRTTPGSGLAAQPVSMQYVNSALAAKADDGSVVHLNGSETISGAKTFSSAPNVPAPAATGQVANKAYVDQAVANAGTGSYLSTAGGVVTGPITLPGNPSAPLQAAPKQYVDAGISGKADLMAGLVPRASWEREHRRLGVVCWAMGHRRERGARAAEEAGAGMCRQRRWRAKTWCSRPGRSSRPITWRARDM